MLASCHCTAKVRVAGNKFQQAIANLKEICDAAITSANQYHARIQALKKAREAEELAKKREDARIEKEQKKAKDKELAEENKRKRKAEQEVEKQRKKEEDALAKEEKGDDGKEAGDEGHGSRRRGQGLNELTDDDPSVLRHRFPDFAVKVVPEFPEFLDMVVLGIPVIWKCKRSCMKKMMETAGDLGQKDASANAKIIKSHMTGFHGELAQFVEAKARPIELKVEVHINSFSFSTVLLCCPVFVF